MPSRQARIENRRARTDANLVYGGQVRALKRLRAQLRKEMRQEQADYLQAGEMNYRSAKAALPQVQKAMNEWMGPVAQARSNALRAEVDKLPEGVYKSVLRAEATEAPTRLTKLLADTSADLVQRQVAARIQGQQGAEGARARYRSERDKVTTQLHDTLKDAGMLTQQRRDCTAGSAWIAGQSGAKPVASSVTRIASSALTSARNAGSRQTLSSITRLLAVLTR